jgi:alpha-beta hydrolase superfamily lysophospholipase
MKPDNIERLASPQSFYQPDSDEIPPFKHTTLAVEFGRPQLNLYGELLLPKRQPPLPAAIMTHGLGSGIPALRPTAQQMAKRGIATFIFDFRGHGRSGGLCDENMSEDVVAAFLYLSNHPQIDRQRIALVGHSMGATAAVQAMQELDGLGSLVCLSPPGDPDEEELLRSASESTLAKWGDTEREYPANGYLPWLPSFFGNFSRLWMWLRGYRLRVNWRRYFELWRTIRMAKILAQKPAYPLLLVHCKGDRAVSTEGVQKLYNEAAPPKELWLAPGGFHSTPLLRNRLRLQWINWLATALNTSN